MPYPFQIVQGADQILIAYEFGSFTRIIHMGDAPPPTDVKTWMGHSTGAWDGDSLVVTVTDQRADTWFDAAGNFHSDALVVTERYTRQGDNHLLYEATIEDPAVYTEPWTIQLPLYRRLETGARILEYKCVEFAEPMMYGDPPDPGNSAQADPPAAEPLDDSDE
jgi:hypothetical protein